MRRVFVIGVLCLLAIGATQIGPAKRIKMGKAPTFTALNPASNLLYVTNFASDEVWAVDTQTHVVRKRFYAGFEPLGIAVTPAGDKIFVTNMGPGLVKVISAKDYSTIDDIKVGSVPSNVIISPRGSMAFVTNFGKGKIGKVDFVDTDVPSHRGRGRGRDSAARRCGVARRGPRLRGLRRLQ